MNNNNIIKRITAIVFVIIITTVFIYTNLSLFIGLSRFFNNAQFADTYVKEKFSFRQIEKDVLLNILQQENLINLHGFMAKKLNMHSLYNNWNIYIADNCYIVSAYPYTSTDYEFNQIISLKNFLDKRNIKFLYVNEPTKYVVDKFISDSFGVKSYTNNNADRFLKRIKVAGVATVDLREKLQEDGLNAFDLFYRTDHHWTTRGGLWATKKISEGLNQYCGYQINTSMFDENHFSIKKWEKCWLGEQGRKVGETYVGLDNYEEIKPNFKTDYFFKTSKNLVKGNFNNFIDEDVYNTKNSVYQNKSWHYSYRQIACINNIITYGKILVLGDSSEQVVIPFLSLGVHELDCLIMRDCPNSFNLRKFIVDNKYDTVIIAYTQHMIGAHDNPESANYKMFELK